jgi:hypothetical protein
VQRVLKGLVGLIGLLLGLIGLQWMFVPGSVAEQFGLALSGLPGLSTGRADLGGLFVACAVMSFLGLRKGGGAWLYAVAMVMVCIAFGRTIGLLADGFHARMLAFTVFELVLAALLVAAGREAPASA